MADALARHADAFGADQTPAPAPLSATVVLVRDDPADGLQTYLMQRHGRMPFAPLRSVFPGGAVEPFDDPSAPELACAVRELREETGLRVEPAALRPWARWTTPEVAPVRFETAFYLTTCPTGQQPADISGEADTARWWGVRHALEAAELGILSLLPPTRAVLLELADCPDVAAVLARTEDRVVAPVLPGLERDGAGYRFRYPEPPG